MEQHGATQCCERAGAGWRSWLVWLWRKRALLRPGRPPLDTRDEAEQLQPSSPLPHLRRRPHLRARSHLRVELDQVVAGEGEAGRAVLAVAERGEV